MIGGDPFLKIRFFRYLIGYSDLFWAWLLGARTQRNGARTVFSRRSYASAQELQLHSAEEFLPSQYKYELN